MDRTDIRDATAELAKLPLTKLSLRQTNVHDESIKVLCHSNIEYLDLGRTNLTNKAADYMITHSNQIKILADVTNISKEKREEIKKRTENNKQKREESSLRASLFKIKSFKPLDNTLTKNNTNDSIPTSSPTRSNGSPYN